MTVPSVGLVEMSTGVRVPIDAVGASSNRACATCQTVAMVHLCRVPITARGARSNRACAMCPTVAMIC
jgi:hypothetical protein